MSSYALQYWQNRLVKSNPHVLLLKWNITAAKTVSPQFSGLPVLTAFDAISTQATIDDFLGTTSEFTVAQFDSTSMGADAFGGIINMGGQAAVVGGMLVRCSSGTAGATQVIYEVGVGTLTASTLETAIALGSQGNIAFKVSFGNTPDFDALTAGVITAEITWLSK